MKNCRRRKQPRAVGAPDFGTTLRKDGGFGRPANYQRICKPVLRSTSTTRDGRACDDVGSAEKGTLLLQCHPVTSPVLTSIRPRVSRMRSWPIGGQRKRSNSVQNGPAYRRILISASDARPTRVGSQVPGARPGDSFPGEVYLPEQSGAAPGPASLRYSGCRPKNSRATRSPAAVSRHEL